MQESVGNILHGIERETAVKGIEVEGSKKGGSPT